MKKYSDIELSKGVGIDLNGTGYFCSDGKIYDSDRCYILLDLYCGYVKNDDHCAFKSCICTALGDIKCNLCNALDDLCGLKGTVCGLNKRVSCLEDSGCSGIYGDYLPAEPFCLHDATLGQDVRAYKVNDPLEICGCVSAPYISTGSGDYYVKNKQLCNYATKSYVDEKDYATTSYVDEKIKDIEPTQNAVKYLDGSAATKIMVVSSRAAVLELAKDNPNTIFFVPGDV